MKFDSVMSAAERESAKLKTADQARFKAMSYASMGDSAEFNNLDASDAATRFHAKSK